MIKNYLLAFFLFTSSLVFGQVKVFEDFNVSMTPAGWTNSLNSGSLISRQTTVNSYGRTGTVAAVRANNYNVTSGNRARLESNTFTNSVAGDSMVFDVAHITYPGSTDSLIIHVFNGTSFIRLIGWGSSQTLDTINGITIGAAITGSFTPTSSQWCRKTLALPVGTSRIRFEFYSDYGNGLYIDRVLVATPSAPTVATGSSSIITTSSVSLSGVINTSFPSITSSGIVVGTSANPTIGSFGVIDSTTNPVITSGTFTKSIAGLSNSTLYYYRTYAINSIGTTYGADSTFTTNSSAVIPTVIRSPLTNLQATSATLNANISSDGGSPVTASGFVYSTITNPLLFGTSVIDSTTSPAVLLGNLSVNPAGLVHSTKYYYKAYATNGIGTAYSIQDSFTTDPIVTAMPYFQNFDSLSNTGFKSNIVSGATNDWVVGTPTKTNISAAYSSPNAWVTKTSGNYTIISPNNAAVTSPQFDFTTHVGDPVLRFQQKFRLNPFGAGYDAATVEISINGGTWTRLDNNFGTGANFNSSNGSIAWYNGPNFISAGAIFTGNSSAYSSQSNGWIQTTTRLTGAAGQSNVKFRFRFDGNPYGGSDEGWAFDNVEVFRSTIPTVVTGSKTNVTTASADLSGSIISNGNSTITRSGVVYSLAPAPVLGAVGVVDSTTNPLVVTGNYSKNITGLTLSTTYYYRAYAINSVGTAYGADSTITTNSSAVIPTVLRVAATNITALTATFGGNITSDGGSTVTASGIVYSTTTNPLLSGTGVTDSTTNPLITIGSYSFSTSGLIHSTKYYFRAYATNSVGTAYSSLDSFTTAPIVSVLPYSQNFDIVGTTGWSSIATGGLNEWVLGTPAKIQLNGSYSSPNCWFTSTGANYSDNHNGALVSPQFDFTSYTADPIVKFRHNFVTEAGWDASILEISINGGTWTKLDNTLGTGSNFNTTNSLSWYNSNSTFGPISPNKWSDNSNLYSSSASNWIQSQTALTGAAGQPNVKFRIRFGSDGSGTDEGVAVDNIEVVAPTAPVVVTGTKTNITTNSADLAGTITSNGNSTITKSGIVYSTSSSPILGAIGVVDSTTNPLVVNGSFTKSTTGLSVSTLYYFRAYAVNAVGTSYGADSTFTTNSTAVIPTVLKIAATNLTTTTATVGGNITSDGGSPITASGIVYNTSITPLTLSSSAIDSTTSPVITSGIYSINPAGLTHSTKYYFKAYATNGVGTAYSAVDSFTTNPIVSTLPYNQNFESGAGGWSSMLSSTSTSVNWIVGLPTNNNWVLGTPAKTYLNGARSGTKAWATKLTGSYDSDHDASIVSPQFDFTSYTADPIVRFSHKFKAETDWDGLIVEISINGGFWNRLDSVVGTGSNFNTNNSYAWYNDNVNLIPSGGVLAPPYFSNDMGSGTVFASQVSGWIESAYRLTGAASQSNVRFRFRFISDGFVADEGWAIDDIEVVNITTPTTTASAVTISSVTNTTANVSCTIGNGQRRLIVARLTSAPAVAPTNNKLYNANAIYSLGDTTGTGNFIVFNGTGNTVAVTGLTALTNYTFDVYEFNGKYMHNAFASAATSITTTLPVKLTYFEAKKANDDVKLVWITSSEINNKGFEVQRSINGKTFETIAFVKGEGNSNNNIMYSSIDENAFAKNQVKKLYYRLNQVDFDGKSTLSSIREVSINDVIGDDVRIYPNPFTNEITIETVNTENTISTVQIIDISGRVLMSQTEAVNIGLGTIKLSNTSNLSAGIYLVKISTNGVVKTMKIVKQ